MHYVHGDVILTRVARLPKGAKLAKEPILAHGETTGHRHEVFDGTVYVDERGRLFVKAGEGTTLRHVSGKDTPADHKTHRLAKGIYEVSRERSYEPDGWRQVAD